MGGRSQVLSSTRLITSFEMLNRDLTTCELRGPCLRYKILYTPRASFEIYPRSHYRIRPAL